MNWPGGAAIYLSLNAGFAIDLYFVPLVWAMWMCIDTETTDFYRTQGEVMISQASVILSTIGLMATRSLLIFVTAWSVRILQECFLVFNCLYFLDTFVRRNKETWFEDVTIIEYFHS